MFNYTEFGKGVRYFRKQKDLTLEKLATLSNTGIPYLISIEKGQAKPSLKKITNICNALNVGISDCLSTDKEMDKVLYKQFKAKALKIPVTDKQFMIEIMEVFNSL